MQRPANDEEARQLQAWEDEGGKTVLAAEPVRIPIVYHKASLENRRNPSGLEGRCL